MRIPLETPLHFSSREKCDGMFQIIIPKWYIDVYSDFLFYISFLLFFDFLLFSLFNFNRVD